MDSTRCAVLFNKSGRLFESVLCFNLFINQNRNMISNQGNQSSFMFTHSIKFSNMATICDLTYRILEFHLEIFSNIFYHGIAHAHVSITCPTFYGHPYSLLGGCGKHTHTHTQAHFYFIYCTLLLIDWLLISITWSIHLNFTYCILLVSVTSISFGL